MSNIENQNNELELKTSGNNGLICSRERPQRVRRERAFRGTRKIFRCARNDKSFSGKADEF